MVRSRVMCFLAALLISTACVRADQPAAASPASRTLHLNVVDPTTNAGLAGAAIYVDIAELNDINLKTSEDGFGGCELPRQHTSHLSITATADKHVAIVRHGG